MKNTSINQIIKKIFLLILTVLVSQQVSATHYRAGEITYEHIEGYSYRIRLVVYTDTGAAAGNPLIEIRFGDGTSEMVARTYEVYLPNNYKQNNYQIEHKYSGPGSYVISIEDAGRNEGIRNIPNSVNKIFALKTILQINSSLGVNSSPYFENPPFGQVLVDSLFIYNSNAIDGGDDSLSYKLTECLGDNTQPIDNYLYPKASKSLSVDPVNGDLIWETPVYIGLYNIAVEIEEWRSGVKIGSIIRDMQFEVVDKLTGIADLSKSKINIYPNPTNDIIHFDFAGNEIEHIKIIDLTGKLILEKTSVQRNEILDLSLFQNGVYFILIQTDKEILFHKVIKE
ncbi:MAG: hypothetical protein DRI95_03170 [Bacteroidetes bacterium]|nr:MAG: hypothetical protein DRI95_03170 [Bacteroidota bacterium]